MADRSVSVSLRAEVSGYVAGMRAAQVNTAALTRELEKSAKQRQALSQLGNTAGIVGLGAAAAFGAAVVSAANFDQAMSKIQAATHETSANMDLLRTAAIQAGQATQYSASEAAGGIEALAKAGVTTTDILHGGLAGALSLAAAGNQSVADSAETAASAMTQFGLSGKEVPHIADLLAAGAGKAQGEVSDLAMALNQAGLVASQTGVSIEEATGTLAAFAHAGLIGSDAGTSFKTMLLRLTPQSKQSAQLMDYLGVSAFDTQGKFIGLANYAGVLHDKLKNMTDQQRQATLTQLFGQDAIRAANVLYQQGAQGIQTWIDKTNDAGYAQETAAIKMDNLKGDVEQLKGSLETLFITTGEGSQGPLRLLVETLTKITNVLNGMPAPAKDVFLAVSALTALLGGGAFFGAKVLTGIANGRNALRDLGVSAERTDAIMAKTGRTFKMLALGSLAVAGLYALDAALKSIGSDNKASETVQELTGQLIDLANGKSTDIAKDFGDIGDAMDTLGSTTNSAVGEFENMIPVLPTVAKGLSGMLGFGNDTVADKMAKASDEIQTLDEALAGLVSSGGVDQAKSAFDDLARSQGLSADQQKQLLQILPGYRDAIAGAANETKQAGGATEGFTGELGGSVQAMKAADKAMEELRKKARATGEQFFNIDKDLKNNKVSLNGWIHDMQQAAQALQNFTANARTAAKRGLNEGLIASLEAAGPAGALRMKQLANATDAQIARANAAWRRGQRAVDDYTSTVTGVPDAKLGVNISGVLGAIATVKQALNSIPNSVGVVINGVHKGSFDVGGYTGDGGRHEVAGLVHRREYVMDANTVDRWGISTFRAMQANGPSGRSMAVASVSRGTGDAGLAAALQRLDARLANLELIPAAVEAGAARGSHSGSKAGVASQGLALHAMGHF